MLLRRTALACLLLSAGCIGSVNELTITPSFTLGGTVSGLQGQLVLHEAAGQNLTVTANGAFVFGEPILEGNSYNVTIGAQPAGMTCAVADGSGTVGNGNVTSVIVGCEASDTTTGTTTGTTSHGTTTGTTTTTGRTTGTGTTSTGGTTATTTTGGTTATTTTGGTTGTAVTGTTGTTTTGTTTTGTTGTTGTTTTGTTTTGGTGTTGTTTGGSTTGTTTGAQTYSLSINLLGATGGVTLSAVNGDTLTFTSDGEQSFAQSYVGYASYTFSVSSVGSGRDCGFDQPEAGQVTNANLVINARCGVAATLVIGQKDFHSSFDPSQAQQNSLNTPQGNGLVVGGALYLPDSLNNRVLGFNAFPSSNNPNANFAVGQPNLNGQTAGSGAGQFSNPIGLASNGTNFVVADELNNRIMIYPSLPTAGTAATAASTVQLTGYIGGSLCRTFLSPSGVSAYGSKLLVPDYANDRVLIYNSMPTNSNQLADVVLGQPDPSTCGGSPASASTLSGPQSVWTDGTHVIVADTGFNRVLIWNTFPTTSGQAADVVVGQPDMATVNINPVPANNSFASPQWVTSDGTHLVVADSTANRVLIWNTLPTTNGAAASSVLGQPTTSDSDSAVYGASAATLNNPSAVTMAPGGILVTDEGNDRFLLYAIP